MDEFETLERVFRSRGYEVVRSSRENHYLLLSKGGSLMAVGYSMAPIKTTDGEAEMFISMGENDSVDSMLFISPMKLSRVVKRIFEKEGVATWDRMALSIAVGEQVLLDWSKVEKEPEERSVMDLFETHDVDPLKEVRRFHREVSSSEVGGFRVREVEIGPSRIGIKEENAIPRETEVLDTTEVKAPERKKEEQKQQFDLPMMPMMDLDPVKEEPKKKPKKTEKTPQKVPEEILMNPWTGFDEWKEEGAQEKKDTKEVVKKTFPSGWEGATLAPTKYSISDANSLAGEKEGTELKKVHYPFLMLEASYMMNPEDGKEPMEQDGTYLYDCIRKEVSDVPTPLFDEISTVADRWDGEHGPDKLTDPKVDHNKAMTAIRNRIRSGRLAQDRKVSDTLMSTVYREIEYRFDPRSLKLICSRRVMLPFWVNEGKKGKQKWAVNGFLGHLVK